MAGNSGEPGRTVTSKLAAILVAFGNGRDFTLSELAMHTNLAISTVHRLLTDLVRTSLLERPDGITYQPGTALHEMLPYVVAPPTLRERAPFVVEDLAMSLRATTRSGIVDGLEVGYIEKAPRAEPGTLFPNAARLPLHATAMGKALLAFGPRSLTRLVHGNGLPRYTARTLACPVELEHDLQKARTHGFAVSDGELARPAPPPWPCPCSTRSGEPSPPSRWTWPTRAGTRSNSRCPRCWWPHAACAGRSPPPSGSIGRSDRGTTRASRLSCGCGPDHRAGPPGFTSRRAARAHAVEGSDHSGRRIPVGDHRRDPIQRRDQGRRRSGERSRRGEQNHLVGDLGQPALHPCLGRRAGIDSTDVDGGGVEEERARPQPGDRVQGGRAHECLPGAGELTAEGDEARAGRRGGALGEQLHDPHGVGDDRPREVVRQGPGELVGRGTGVQGDGVARAHQLDGPAGDAPGTCRAPGDRIGVADGEPDASVHGADLTRRLEPLEVAAHRHGRDAEIAARSVMESTPTSRRRASTRARRCAPGGESCPAPGIASVTGSPPARCPYCSARSAPPAARPGGSGAAGPAGDPAAGPPRPPPPPPRAGGPSSGAG